VVVTRLRPIAALALLVVGSSACATHDASPAFRRSVFVDDRGISVPLPPPSYYEVPEQEVDLHGVTEGSDPIVEGTTLHAEDIDGQAAGEVVLAAGATDFTVEGLDIDLRTHCFEIWLETPDGRETTHAFVRAHITGPKTLETTPGCD
jgi:hypothetical protein